MILRSHITPRDAIASTGIAEHGGDATAVGDSIVRHDFSTCINAHGPSQAVRDAIRWCDVSSYPDVQSVAPRERAAVAWGRPVDEIICGAGAAELIHAVCFAYLSPGDSVLILAPAFGEYHRAASLCGASIRQISMPSTPDASLWDAHLEQVERAIGSGTPRLVFTATPTSPGGIQLNRAQLVRIADACAATGSLLVLDQSYDAFALSPLGTPALPGHPHVFHLRSITKEHALAGVRVAFAIAHPMVAACVERARVPWATSVIAQAAAVAAFLPPSLDHAARTVQLLQGEKQRIEIDLEGSGFAVSPSCTHYLLVHVNNARRARQWLAAQHHVLVRDCTSFGLPQHIRIAARDVAANNALLSALTSGPQLAGEAMHD